MLWATPKQIGNFQMKITEKTISKVKELRATGLSYAKIAKQTKISRSSVIKIIKSQERADIKEGIIRQSLDEPLPDETIEAKVKKPCVNPRLIIIYFDQIEDDAKCIVRPGHNYPRGMNLKVKRVIESEERLYRLA